jgi:gas vesicle protein
MKEILYFLCGAAVGVVVGLLVAPKSGKELRADLQATAEKDLSKLQAEWQAAMAKTNERLDQIQADLKKATQKAQGEEGEVEAEAA